MAEDTISRLERQIRERQAAEEAEAARLQRVAGMKASMSWSPAIGQTICDAIAEGGVLKDICRTLEDVPILKIVREWIRERPGFAQAVREAERVRLFPGRTSFSIRARDDSKDRIAKDNGFVPDPTAVARSKLQCDTLARLLKAHYPTVWGDALTVKQPEPVDHTGGLAKLPIETLEQMRDNARRLEQDDEVRNSWRRNGRSPNSTGSVGNSGKPPLSLAKFLNQ